MVEKTITLEDISPVDFFGIENKVIKEVCSAFPASKIISRGNEIKIIGSEEEIIQIIDILNSLIAHYHKFGRVTEQSVKSLIKQEKPAINSEAENEVLLFGDKGLVLKQSPRMV